MAFTNFVEIWLQKKLSVWWLEIESITLIRKSNLNEIMIWPDSLEIEPMIYRTRGKHANNYTTELVTCKWFEFDGV
jgi:hypothetical protein